MAVTIDFLDDRIQCNIGRRLMAAAGDEVLAGAGGIRLGNPPGDKIRAIDAELAKHGQLRQVETEDHKIDLSKKYEDPHFSLFFDGVGTMPTGDIQAIKAKSKSGKSFLCSILMASILGCRNFGFTSTIKNPKVIYIDTEQNIRNTAQLAKRVHRMLGWRVTVNHDEFSAYNLRTMDTAERLPFIDNIVQTEKPTSVFIDGIADLIENFNDIDQSSILINHLMQLSGSTDCSVTCVLHTNKAKDDNGMKGHLGTMLQQKASDVFETKRVDGVFNVEETDCRNQSIPDFSFGIDTEGMPYSSATIKENKQLKKLEGIRKILKECFSTDSMLTFGELVKRYCAYSAKSDRTAKRAISDAREKDLLHVSPDGEYSLQ